MPKSDLARVLSVKPAPRDQMEIQERTLSRLDRLSRQDPAQLAREYQTESLKRLARLVENASRQAATHER